ncbi:MAG: hypothetical protein QXZ17_13275, partial [Nitrososphaerota archaeon]
VSSSSGPTIENPTALSEKSNISLPSGSQVYLYGFQTGGYYPTTNFTNGAIQITNDPLSGNGYIYNDLAITPINQNSYSTGAVSFVIAGIGISNYVSMEYNYSVMGHAVNFTLTAESLAVVIQDGGDTAEPGSGIPGLTVAAGAVGPPYNANVSISYAYLAAGKYKFDPNYGASVTGIFIFYGNSTTFKQNDIIFNETGLQKGDQWAVTFETTTGYEVYSSMPSGLPPSNESIVIPDMTPGTYQYVVGFAQNNGGTSPMQMENITMGYHISPSQGTINFNGSVTYINVTFTPLAYYETDPIGGNYSSLDISSNSYMTSNLYITGNITISAGVTLYTQGYSILATGSFLNYGTIITGWPYNGGNSTVPTPISYPDSYGGSGGGSDTHDRFTIPGGNGGSTIAAGGSTVFATYAGNGGTPAPPVLNNSMLETMYRDGFQNYLTGAGGGFAYGWGALNGGSGAYGLYVQANKIVAGDIYAYGLQDANISDMQNGGGGGGGVIILAYGDGGYTPGNYDISGGISTDMQTGSASGGGSGGNGQVVTYYYSNSPPIAIRAPLTYTVEFTQTGLPSGTLWSVTLNGTTESSTSTSISFSEPNGTYSYAIGSVKGFSVSLPSGTITVNGASQTVNVYFKPTSWFFSPAFDVNMLYAQAPIKIGYGFLQYTFNLPLSIYLITSGYGISQEEFMQNISFWFGLNLELMNNQIPSTSMLAILNFSGILSFTQELNNIYNETVGFLHHINFVSEISQELDNGNLTVVTGFSFGLPSLSSDVSVLEKGLSAMIGQLKGGSNKILSLANFISALLETIGSTMNIDVGNLVSVGENVLAPGMLISTSAILQGISNMISTITKLTSVSINFLRDLATATVDAFIGNLPLAALNFAEGVINGLDLALNFVAPNNPITNGWNWITRIVDPNGTTIVPTIYQNGKPVLGNYNGSFNWSSHAGIVIEAGNQWTVLDTNITNSEFVLTHIGSNNTAVPYITTISETGVNATISSGTILDDESVRSNVSVIKENGIFIANWSNTIDLKNVSYAIRNGIMNFTVEMYKNSSLISGYVSTYLNGNLYTIIYSSDGIFKGSVNLPQGKSIITFEPSSDLGFGGSSSLYVSNPYYTVTMMESGLPSGATWNVTLNGVKQSSSTSSITFSEPNGSYYYTVG